MRGKVKHSNEVLVFLGDGYFVSRTAHECQPIINRRKESKSERETNFVEIQAQLNALDSTLQREQSLQSVLQEELSSEVNHLRDQ